MKFRVHIPTRFMSVIDVEAANKTEAVAKAIRFEGDFVDSRFVEHLLDEVGEGLVDEVA